MYYAGFLIPVVCVLFFLKAGEEEGPIAKWLWPFLSASIWVLAVRCLHFGAGSAFVVQLGFFASLTAWKMCREEMPKRRS